jgi:release factor glutamine methyltransferase
VKKGARVLDMGTGSGILGIIAAKQASEVLAVDINPFAVSCAKQNAKHNNVGNVEFLQGDLFAPLAQGAKFDLILFNSPYLPSEKDEEESWLRRAWAGGTTGRQVIDRFILETAHHLEKNGEIMLMQSNLANIEETKEKFNSHEMKTEVAATLDLPFFETLTLIRAAFPS